MPDEATEHLAGDSPAASEATIEDYFSENRVFPPSEEFRRQAVLGDGSVYDQASAQFPCGPP